MQKTKSIQIHICFLNLINFCFKIESHTTAFADCFKGGFRKLKKKSRELKLKTI